MCLIAILFQIVPFHKDFSPSGEQLEHRKLAYVLYAPRRNRLGL